MSDLIVNWDEKNLLPKITLNLKLAGGIVSDIPGAIKHAVPNAHFKCNWPRTKKEYMFYLKGHLTSQDMSTDNMKNTFNYCSNKNLKLIIICNSYETTLNKMANDENEYEIKIIQYSKMDQILKAIINSN